MLESLRPPLSYPDTPASLGRATEALQRRGARMPMAPRVLLWWVRDHAGEGVGGIVGTWCDDIPPPKISPSWRYIMAFITKPYQPSYPHHPPHQNFSLSSHSILVITSYPHLPPHQRHSHTQVTHATLPPQSSPSSHPWWSHSYPWHTRNPLVLSLFSPCLPL